MASFFRNLPTHRHFHRGWRHFWRQIGTLLINPVFVTLSVFGHGLMLAGALVVYLIESPVNPQIKTYLDALWWSVSTVTTIGYGDVTPQTVPGRIIGILMMLAGTAIFAGFTGLFASALITPEVSEIDSELKDLEKRLSYLDGEKGKKQS